MAYAAVISLKHNLELLGAIDSVQVNNELKSLGETLRRLDGARNRSNTSVINALDDQIREAVFKLEDFVESQVLHLSPPWPYYTHFRKMKVKQLREYTRELNRPVPREEEEEDVVLPTEDSEGKKSTTTVGLLDQIEKIINELVDPQLGLKAVSVFGMAGIGKTHLASQIYQHPTIRQHFNLLVWVSLGPQHQLLKHDSADIIAELERKPKKLYLETNIITLVELVQRGLFGRRYLIVLDDVRSTAGCTNLLRGLRVEGKGGRVLLTTRLEQVTKDLETSIHKIRFLNNEESWDLLWKNVFGDKSSFPPQLEKAGKKIAEICEGLPLLILAVADILSAEDTKTEEYWNKVADKKTTTFPDAYDRISKFALMEQEILTFLETVEKLSEEYTRELQRPVPRDEEEDGVVLSTDDFGGKISTTTIGLSYQIENIVHEFVDPQSELITVSVFGMAGIGKTHLAREIYQHPIIRQHFDLLVWVSLGPQQQQKHVWAGIVAELERKPKKLYLETNIMTLVQLVQRGLFGRRYLIVLDDVWSTAGCTSLLRLLRVEGNGGRVILTTRLEQVAKDLETNVHKIRFLNNEESWDLLWKNVFGDKSSFPPQLEKAGKKIAEICEGLPLLILAVADILSGEDKTEEYWNMVADKKTTTFPDAYDRISKVLFSSYEYLPQYLKPCFLYMGVFPQSSEIPLSKLINLLVVEDFMESELPLTKVFTKSKIGREKPKPQSTREILFQPEQRSLPGFPKNSKGFVLPKEICEAMRTPPSPCRFEKAFKTLYLLEPGPSLTRFITPFEKFDLLGQEPRVVRPSRKKSKNRLPFQSCTTAYQSDDLIHRVAAPSRYIDSSKPKWYNDTVDIIATSELFLMECVEKLVSNSLAIICMHSSRERIKSCKLHSAYWYLCFKEARKTKFFLVMKKLGDVSKEHMESQRRLSIQNNILFGIKEVYDSMASTSLTTRSLLCTGKDHEYPVPICLKLMLLKVLDALAIRFYEFPIDVLELVRLRYLTLTHNGKLPPSISKLQELQFMIVRQHHNIKLLRNPTYVPDEIWDLQKLTHLRIMGSNVPDPSTGAKLRKLYTLHMNAHSCTEAVFRGIPCLKKLGIRVELQPDSDQTITCFEHIEVLDKLESLKCVVVNPRLRTQPLSPPDHLSKFPNGLTKLCLNGLGYSWEYMSAIGSLPNLKVLKVRFSAFRGAEWETKVRQFRRLEFLLLEDIDVVHWTTTAEADSNAVAAAAHDDDDDDGYDDDGCFPRLRRLIIRHCYRLKEIPQSIPALESLEVVDCSPTVVASARRVQEESNDYVEVMIKSSWNL